MSKEKLSSEKMLWAEHPGSVLWETGEGALLQERVLSGVFWIPVLAVKAQNNLGLCSPSTEPFSAPLPAQFLRRVQSCPAADGVGAADPAHAHDLGFHTPPKLSFFSRILPALLLACSQTPLLNLQMRSCNAALVAWDFPKLQLRELFFFVVGLSILPAVAGQKRKQEWQKL